MKHQYNRPHPSITAYIKTVLIIEGTAKQEKAQQPVFTNGMPALVCKTEKNQAGAEPAFQLTLFAKSAPAEYWQAKPNTTIIAYFFNPFSMACVFNMPVQKLMTAPLDLGLWDAHKTNALKMQLLYANSITDKIEVLNNLVIQQINTNRKDCEIIKYATDAIMYNPGPEILPAIIQQLNITERTFQRVFKKYIGITPNQYRRICQFQFSFTQLRGNDFEKLTDVAFDNGFADQSHFIRSFKEFTAITPQEYLRFGLKRKT